MERHSLDPLSLVGGLVLVGAGLLGLFGSIDIGLDAWQYLGPLVLIAIGAVLVLAAPWSRGDRQDAATRNDASPEDAAPVAEPAGETAETTDIADTAEDTDPTAELPRGADEEA
ncbi:MAG: hypothetical protein ACRDUY_02940 [Nitriliruptorales bacterium]